MKKVLLTLALFTLNAAFGLAGSATYQVTDVIRDANQTLKLKGIVTNTGTAPIEFISVHAEGYNSKHEIVDQSSDFPICYGIALRPWQTVHFEISLHDRDGNEITAYETQVQTHS
jgi:pentose-5-phosphate-3-epimerase